MASALVIPLEMVRRLWGLPPSQIESKRRREAFWRWICAEIKAKEAELDRHIAACEAARSRSRDRRIEREYQKWLKDQRRAEEERKRRTYWGWGKKKYLVPGHGYADPRLRSQKLRAQMIANARAKSARRQAGGE